MAVKVGWVEVKYYPVDQSGKLIKEPHRMTLNNSSIVAIRETDNDVGKIQCHILVMGGIDFVIEETYDAVTLRL